MFSRVWLLAAAGDLAGYRRNSSFCWHGPLLEKIVSRMECWYPSLGRLTSVAWRKNGYFRWRRWPHFLKTTQTRHSTPARAESVVSGSASLLKNGNFLKNARGIPKQNHSDFARDWKIVLFLCCFFVETVFGRRVVFLFLRCLVDEDTRYPRSKAALFVSIKIFLRAYCETSYLSSF